MLPCINCNIFSTQLVHHMNRGPRPPQKQYHHSCRTNKSDVSVDQGWAVGVFELFEAPLSSFSSYVGACDILRARILKKY